MADSLILDRPRVSDELLFARLEPEHLLKIRRQPSQRTILGMDAAMGEDEAEGLAAQEIAFSAFAGNRLLACLGIAEQFPGRQGVAWAIMAEGIGRHHVALTRFAQFLVANSGLARIECIAQANDIEHVIARVPDADPWAIVQAVLADPTPEIRWAIMVGFAPAHVLRRYGGLSETCLLLERLG